MNYRDVLISLHHTECNIAEDEIAYLNKSERESMPVYRKIMQDAINRAYVLGEIIDNLPVELAEREV